MGGMEENMDYAMLANIMPTVNTDEPLLGEGKSSDNTAFTVFNDRALLEGHSSHNTVVTVFTDRALLEGHSSLNTVDSVVNYRALS